MILLTVVFLNVLMKPMYLLLAHMLMIQQKDVCHNVQNLHGLMLKILQEHVCLDALIILLDKIIPGSVYNSATNGRPLQTIPQRSVSKNAQLIHSLIYKPTNVLNSVQWVTLGIIPLGDVF